jgi:protein pelota
VLKAFVKHVDFNVVRCAVIASPGDIKDQFYRYLLLEAERRLELKLIIKNKSRFVLAQTSSGNKHALEDVLGAPNVMNLIKDTKAAQEIRDLKDFSDMLLNDSARACYGPKHVEFAQEEYMATQTLLITDDLFRNNADIPTRRKFAHLVKSVKDSGGTARIFSSMHVSGEQLAMYSGIAAVLRFPLPDLEHIEV